MIQNTKEILKVRLNQNHNDTDHFKTKDILIDTLKIRELTAVQKFFICKMIFQFRSVVNQKLNAIFGMHEN